MNLHTDDLSRDGTSDLEWILNSQVIRIDISHNVQAENRSFCVRHQSPTPSLLLEVSRPESICSQHVRPGLIRDDNVRLSTDTNTLPSGVQDRHRELSCYSDRPSIAETHMAHRTTIRSTRPTGPAHAAGRESNRSDISLPKLHSRYQAALPR